MSNIILDYSQNFEKIETIDLLRSYPVIGVRHGDAVLVVGGTTTADGGGGVYIWNEDSVEEDNGGNIIKPTAIEEIGQGRWIGIMGGSGGGSAVRFVQETLVEDEFGNPITDQDFLPVGDIYLNGLTVDENGPNAVTLRGSQLNIASVGEGFVFRTPITDLYLRDLQLDVDEFGQTTLVDPGQPLWVWEDVNGGRWISSLDQTAIRVKAGPGITVETEEYTDNQIDTFGQRSLVISANIPPAPEPAPFYPLVQNITGTATNLNPSSTFYMRFTNASSKTLTVQNSSNTFYNDENTEWTIRNAGAGVLTIAAQAGVTINPPASGVLTLNNGATARLKRISDNVFDLIV